MEGKEGRKQRLLLMDSMEGKWKLANKDSNNSNRRF